MGRKSTLNTKPIDKKPSRKPRRRQQRKARKQRLKAFYDGTPDSDLDYYENGLEYTLEPDAQAQIDD